MIPYISHDQKRQIRAITAWNWRWNWRLTINIHEETLWGFGNILNPRYWQWWHSTINLLKINDYSLTMDEFYYKLYFNKTVKINYISTVKIFNEFQKYLSIIEWQFWDLVTRDACRNAKTKNLFRKINILRKVYKGDQRKTSKDKPYEWSEVGQKTSGWEARPRKGDILDGGDIGHFKEHSSILMPKRAPEERAPVVTVDIPNTWWRAISSVHSKPNSGSSENRTLKFILFSFLGERRNLSEGGFLLSLKMQQKEPSEALWLSLGERQPLQPKETTQRGAFSEWHMLFSSSPSVTQIHFTQTFACVFFPLPWLPASRLCTQCFPTPAPPSESAWWKH